MAKHKDPGGIVPREYKIGAGERTGFLLAATRE